jgi:neutral ceramidase
MKRKAWFLTLLLVAAAAALSRPATPAAETRAANEFRVGAAKVDITPNPAAMPVTLNGYGGRGGKPATGVLDPIYARALAVADPAGRRVALVVLDLCFVDSEVRDRVVDKLAPHGYGEHNLMIAGTHTHAAPSGYDRRRIVQAVMGPFDQRILDQVVNGIVAAVLAADAALRPAVLSTDTSELLGMNRSRRDPAFDVGVGGFDSSSPIKPDPVKYQTDRRLTVVRAVGLDGKPIALLVHFASHPTVLSPDNMKISADWPGVMNSRLEQDNGGTAIFLNGALGDAAPTPDWSTVAKEIQDMHAYGEKMAAAVEKRLPSLQPLTDKVVGGHVNRTDLSRVQIRLFGGMPVHPGLAKVLYLRPDAPFQALRIGRLIVLGAPGEPTTLVARELESLCDPTFHCLISGPVNDYWGYFVTGVEYEEGGYAPDSCYIGPHAVTKLKAAFWPSATIVQAAP